MVITLLVALLVAGAAGSETLLTYGPPFVQAPQGFSLFDMASNTFLKVPPTVALLAKGGVRGLLASTSHLVIYGGFHWIMIDDVHSSASNIAVMEMRSGAWSALTPSVFGKAVYDATWEEEGKRFFVVGQLQGLDTAPGSDLVGVALCTIGKGCVSVQEGLNNVPVASASIAWNAGVKTLTVLWEAQPGEFSMASWSNAIGWTYRDLPPKAQVANLYISASGRFVLALQVPAFEITFEPLLCGLKLQTMLALATPADQSLQGCWYEVATPAILSLPQPLVASASGIFYTVGIVPQNVTNATGNFTAGVRRFADSVDVDDITYNLVDLIVFRGQDFATDLLQVRVFGETVLLQLAPLCSGCAGRMFVLGDTTWTETFLPMCPGETRWPRRMGLAGGTLFWLCGQSGITIMAGSLNETALAASWAVSNLDSVFAAGRIRSMCEVGQSVWIKGDFGAVGVPAEEAGDGGGVMQTPDGSVVWLLGTQEVQIQPLPGYCFGCSSPLASCQVDRGSRVMWVVYTRSVRPRTMGLSVAKYDFSEVEQNGNIWALFHPELAGDIAYSSSSALLSRFSSGPLLLGPYLVIPYSFSFVRNSTIGAALFRLDTRLLHLNSTVWEPFVFFNESDDFSFVTVFPTFAGIRKDPFRNSVWVYGEFVFSDGVAGNETLYVNIINIDLDTLRVIPTQSTLLPSQTQSSLLTGDVGVDLLWVGGTLSSLPGTQVLNVAGMDMKTGLWAQSTVQFGAPPSFAQVSQLVFNTEKSHFAVVSRDPTPGYEFSGMNIFSPSEVFPDPSVAMWVVNIDRVLPLNMVVAAPPLAVAMLLIVSALILVGISALIGIIWRLGARKSFRYIEIPNYMAHGVKTNVQAILQDSDVLKLPMGAVELGGLIGQGGQGIVRRAKYDGRDVAAKAVVDFSQEVFSSFLKEIKMLASISHPNIVTFLGIYFDHETLYLITELMDTDLAGILAQLDDRMRIQVTIDIASAVAFLHSFQPPVLHRDLKPGNILVSRDGRIKLADFGVSRLLMDSQTQKAQMTRDAGTLLYMAPEVFSSNAGYGTSADVYSYALVVLEIFTGESPFSEVDFRFMLEFVDMIVSKRVSPNVSRLPVSCPEVICEIVRQASSYEAEKRPSAQEILKRLNAAFRGMSGASLPVQKHLRGSGGSNPSSAALPSLRKVRSNEPNAAPPVSAAPVSKGKDEAE